jgi:cytidylate kinase
MFSKKINAVAIDGPAGSGKSTVSRLVAEKLGYLYIDTGAMYRALTLKAMRLGLDLADERALIELSGATDIKLMPSDKKGFTIKVLLDNEDVSCQVRTLDVTRNVKYVARIGGVRENLVKIQRKMVADIDGSVMEGRDIGTVVLPNARHKVFLDAAFEERVNRRYAELKGKGEPATRQDVAEDLKQRDHADRTRDVGPLKQADDAWCFDTTGFSIEQVIEKIVDYVKKNNS